MILISLCFSQQKIDFRTAEEQAKDPNVALKDGKPFLHAHITLGTHDMEVFGGHLFEMEVAAVGEFIIHDFRDETHRKMNDEIGLATLSLCKIEE